MKTRATELLGTRYPIVQSGMRWAARAELVAAVSNAGAFGLLSAHTQPDAEALRREIARTRTLTHEPFGVNLTLLAANAGIDIDGYVRVVVEEGVPVVERLPAGAPLKLRFALSGERVPCYKVAAEVAGKQIDG